MESMLTSHDTQATIDPATKAADKSILIDSALQNQPSNDDLCETKQGALGKFKDSRELLSAYNNLEKEFTKRSQKLKSLEGEAVKALSDKQDAISRTIKRMAELNPELGAIITESAQLQADDGGDNPRSFEDTVAIALLGKVAPKDIDAKQSYVDKIIEGDSLLKERILSKALDKLPSLSSPKLNKYRGQTMITPPNRPQNLAEAGRLAENILNNRSR